MKNTTRVMAQLQRILNDIKERESVMTAMESVRYLDDELAEERGTK